MQPSFVHLRLHSEYSIVDGIVRLDEAIAGFRSSLRTSLDRGMVEQQPHAATGLARALLMKDASQRDEVAELAELLDRLAVSGDVDTRRRAFTTRAMLAAVRRFPSSMSPACRSSSSAWAKRWTNSKSSTRSGWPVASSAKAT